MLSRRLRVKEIICICTFTIIAMGCSITSPRSNYYLLSVVNNDSADHSVNTHKDGVILGIGPVSLPEYVDRRQVVTRTSQNEITFSEFERWAEPLTNNFSRVFKENLAVLIKTDDIFMYPYPQDIGLEYIITADVIRFDAILADSAVLEVRWSLWRGNDHQMLINRKSKFETPFISSKYDVLVAAMSSSLSQFSLEVATAVMQNYRKDHRN